MSDIAKGTAAEATGPTASFTEREMQMLAWAMQSLKSGPPEIDYDKLAGFAGMSNPRSASNAWAKIRSKLNVATGEGAMTTPKKGGAKKKAVSETDGADGETPKKSPRKRAPKKQDVDGEGSPKKKTRAPKGKKNANGDDLQAKTEDDTKEEGSAESQEPEQASDSKPSDPDMVEADEI